eukprot:4267486-Alexandrium_andersonii.AAC.1
MDSADHENEWASRHGAFIELRQTARILVWFVHVRSCACLDASARQSKTHRDFNMWSVAQGVGRG